MACDRYGGPPLKPGTAYIWTVSSTTTGCAVAPAPSDPAVFITSLFGGWANGAAYIWPDAGGSTTFGFFRKVVEVPGGKPVARATVSITAITDDVILTGYKLYIGGELVNVGPGRGEAPIWGGDGEYASKPYTTLDVTSVLNAAVDGGKVLLAVQSVGTDNSKSDEAGGVTTPPWPGASPQPLATAVSKPKPSGPPAGLLLQLDLRLADGTVATTVSDKSWMAFAADPYLRPIPGKNWYKHHLEAIDARAEPVGWRDELGFAGGSKWAPPVLGLTAAAAGKSLKPKMARPMMVLDLPVQQAVHFKTNGTKHWYFVDFGKEFQGGVRFATSSGTAGQNFTVIAGESREFTDPKNKQNKGPVTSVVGDTWGYEFPWTLRDGAQVLVQHQYMEFRYLNLVFEGPAPADFNVSAWQTTYEWAPEDSFFACSNATLKAVWDLNYYTVQAGLLDTFTDSNTRERRPYEADGLVASTAHMWLQRDPMWSRHSISYVIQYPTWPVEWVQISVLLAYQDYWNTGQADLLGAYEELLYNNTRVDDIDATGLLNCSAQVRNGCASRPGKGHHIIDWLPGPSGSMFKGSEHTSVNNAFALRGLNVLAELCGVLGRPASAARYQAKAAELKAAMERLMWNGEAFCDGICTEVGNHSGVTTAAWTLFNQIVPEPSVPGVWKAAADWGAHGFGDYGVFVYLAALNTHAGDDGANMVDALAKCDVQSWCAEMRSFNATMTRETWASGTYSHPWGTGAITGVAGGILGVQQTAPAFATFTVKPRIGTMSHASGRVPTLKGYIDVNATRAATRVAVPCNTEATLCVLHRAGSPAAAAAAASTALLDGAAATGLRVEGPHLCTAVPVGCGAGGSARTLELV